MERHIKGVETLVPNDRPINSWIWEPNAVPNQYWDPNIRESVVDTGAGTSAQGEPYQTGSYGSSVEQQVGWMAQQMGNLTSGMATMLDTINAHQEIANNRYNQMSSQVKNIEAVQKGLLQRFNRHFPEDDDEAI